MIILPQSLQEENDQLCSNQLDFSKIKSTKFRHKNKIKLNKWHYILWNLNTTIKFRILFYI